MDLETALARLGRVPRLLVASDYDGVLAPIVTDPARAYPLPGAMAALRELAGRPGTTVALVSGRTRADLMALTQLAEPVQLVGGHGAELTDGIRLEPAETALRGRLEAAVRALVRDRPGVRVETKPTSVVVHTRTADRSVAAEVGEAVRAGPAGWTGVRAMTGKEVIELSVVATHKGTAVEALRERADSDAVLFLGDDVTDENAFAVLRAGDVGVKVGPGETRAGFRVASPAAAVRVLTALLGARSAR